MISYKMEELMPLVTELAKQYTSNESTSVSYEKARQLMEALIYCIEEAEKSDVNEHLLITRERSAKADYERGYQLVIKKVKLAMERYHSMLPYFKHYGNVALYDTMVKGMPEFFRHYDPKFQPQNQILTLDYPVLISVDHLQGIDAIYQYLCFMELEQSFLSELPEYYVEECLTTYHIDHQELLINISSIVLRDMIHRMAGKEFERMKQLNRSELEEGLVGFLKVLVQEKYNGDAALYEYLKADMREFSVWIKAVENN